MPGPKAPTVPGFRDLDLIGRGGFSVVYRAEQEHVGRLVAIKVLTALDVDDRRSRDRFLREARFMGRLSGIPGIVDIYLPVFSEEGHPCIVMPYMAGGSVAERLEREGPLPVRDVVSVGSQIAEALGKAHQKGISHRDIKPENIMLTEDGVPGLADFGIAVAEDQLVSTQTRSTLTVPHVAPERLQSNDSREGLDAAGDIYSLGSTLYTLLAGHPPSRPSEDMGLHEVIRRVVDEPPPPIDRPDVPAALSTLLTSMLAKDPPDRPSSAAAVAERLRHLGVGSGSLQAQPVVAPPVDSGRGADTVGLEGFPPAPLPALPPLPSAPAARDGEPRAGSSSEAGRLQQAAALSDRTVARPVAPTPGRRVEVPEPPPPRRWPVFLGAVFGAAALVLLAALVVTSRTGDQPSDQQAVPDTTSAQPVPLEVPIVETPRALDDEGFAFRWEDPNDPPFELPIYRVFVDGQEAGFDRLESEEQIVLEVRSDPNDDAPVPVDLGAHSYCVVVVFPTVLEGDVDDARVRQGQVESEPACIGPL